MASRASGAAYNLNGQMLSATQNDGRITHRKDFVSGEEVAYQYDALGRLTSATNAATNPWSQTFVYDGFGNLTQRSGSGTPLSIVVDGTNNRLAGETYDANGNWLASPGQPQNSYDIDNRLVSAPAGASYENYEYSFRNERIRKGNAYLVYDLDGQLLGEYERVSFAGGGFSPETAAKRRLYFGGRLIKIGADTVVTDRLGSVVRRASTNYRYYPYGEQIGTPALADSVAFATYTRDGSTGNDYALNRYYRHTNGRFTTADPYQASSGPADPGSWNRYGYVGGDPVNWLDPSGLLAAAPGCRPTFLAAGGSIDTGTNCPPGSAESWGEGGPTFGGPLFIIGVIGGTPGGSSSGAPPPAPQCEVWLKYRLVPGAPAANHAYIYYEVKSGTVEGLNDQGVLEGQPEISPPTITPKDFLYFPIRAGAWHFGHFIKVPISWKIDCGSLLLSHTPAGRGNRPATDPYSGRAEGTWVCDRILRMISALGLYKPVPYWHTGPNSNGAARFFLQAGGLSDLFAPPPAAPGWDVPLN